MTIDARKPILKLLGGLTAGFAGLAALMGGAMADSVTLEIKTAKAGTDDISGTPSLILDLSPSGAKALGDFTSRNVGTTIDIVLGDKVLTSPYINMPILEGSLVITGNFSNEDVAAMIARIEAQAGNLTLRLPDP